MRAFFGLPLTYIQNPEGDALDDDEAGRGVYCENCAGIAGDCGPVIRETFCETGG